MSTLQNLLLLLLAFSQNCISLSPHTFSIPKHRVGVLYEGWHTPAFNGVRNHPNAYSVEDVLQSDGKITMSDISPKTYKLNDTASFWWHVQPEEGYYCIYRKRDNETKGYLPDCPHITQTTTRQAKQLVAAGFDYVLVDNTNIPSITTKPPECPNWDCIGDLIQLRPTQVLFEEWAKLRQKGIPTPQIGIWLTLPSSTANMWEYYIESVYTNQTYIELDLIMRDVKTNKLVFFTTETPDPGLVQKIEASGKIVVVKNWALFSAEKYKQGYWTFMSPCVDEKQQYTTAIVTPDNRPCNQLVTENSPIGTSITVTPSYQERYGSLPFEAAGKFRGLTLKLQFATAFQHHPDYLFMASYNEFVAQMQKNPYPYAESMGIMNDPQRHGLWVDTYGGYYSRDLAPTKEYGSLFWDITTSCLRVYQSMSTKCDNSSEICCVIRPEENFLNVWSLQYRDADHLLTNNIIEKNKLLKEDWHEICVPHGINDVFCVANPVPSSIVYHQASFLLYANNITSTLALYRCYSKATLLHYISDKSDCLLPNSPKDGKMEFLLGYSQIHQNFGFVRKLIVCYHSHGSPYFYHILDHLCAPGDLEQGQFGYVH